MSKIVTRVMMVALVAMLGAKAEAHYLVKGGKVWYCSTCVNAEATEQQGGSVDPTTPHSEEFGFLLTTKKVELLCQDGKIEESMVPINLLVKKIVEQGDIARVIDREGVGPASADVVARFSDLLLKENLKCFDGSLVDLLVRQWEVEINSSACDPKDPTVCDSVSSLSLGNCTLPGKFTLKEYPKNKPPIGTLYDCKVKQ